MAFEYQDVTLTGSNDQDQKIKDLYSVIGYLQDSVEPNIREAFSELDNPSNKDIKKTISANTNAVYLEWVRQISASDDLTKKEKINAKKLFLAGLASFKNNLETELKQERDQQQQEVPEPTEVDNGNEQQEQEQNSGGGMRRWRILRFFRKTAKNELVERRDSDGGYIDDKEAKNHHFDSKHGGREDRTGSEDTSYSR